MNIFNRVDMEHECTIIHAKFYYTVFRKTEPPYEFIVRDDEEEIVFDTRSKVLRYFCDEGCYYADDLTFEFPTTVSNDIINTWIEECALAAELSIHFENMQIIHHQDRGKIILRSKDTRTSYTLETFLNELGITTEDIEKATGLKFCKEDFR